MPSPVKIEFTKIQAPQVGYHGYVGLHTNEQTVLKAGYRQKGWNEEFGKTLTSDILLDQDIPIKARDGAILYIDIYRPADCTDKVPAIISWSPFGKNYNGHIFLPHVTWKACVKANEVSGLEKFEGLGNIEVMGTQEAEDGYDVIEAVATMDWCTGNIGLAGNSHLAISQYFIAAQEPPSLKAIAPWEGCGDLYREQFVRGGIFNMSNFDMIIQWILRGRGGVEDFRTMYKKYPLMCDYWEDKRPDMKRIKIPTLLSGSDHSGIHTMGTIRAWLEIPAKNKWLRWSAYQEWMDLWGVPENNDELMRFFNRFLKNENNGFEESIPRVRMSVLNYGDTAPIFNVAYADYPIPDTHYTELFLSEGGKLNARADSQEGSTSYMSREAGQMAQFTHIFPTAVRLIGMPKVHLFMSCPDHDDMCVYVRLRKLNKEGKAMVNIPFPKDRWEATSVDTVSKADSTGFLLNMGPIGQLRASRRAIDHSKSIHPQYPFHPHDKDEKVRPGTIVELEIGIWQAAIQFDVGEGISIEVFGSNELYPELVALSQKGEDLGSQGKHIVHFGGRYPSRAILPIVPVS